MKINWLHIVVQFMVYGVFLYYSHQQTQSVATTILLGIILFLNQVLYMLLRFISYQVTAVQKLVTEATKDLLEN